jgi:hypothetical protein
MADEQTPEELERSLFDQAVAPEPVADEEGAPKPPSEPPAPAPVPPPEPPPVPPTAAAEAPIPSWRLREEAEGRRAAEDRARALEARLNEIAVHLQQQQKQPDFFESPEAASQALINRAVQPLREEWQRTQMYNSRIVAGIKHGDDKVDEAEAAFMRARDSQILDPADFERVVQSPNRYDAVVQWHRRQAVQSTVGDDPEAWYQKRREAEMNDPKFQAEVLERARQGAAGRPSTTNIPPSLSKATAAASSSGDPLGDMSDKSLFAYATRPSPRRTQ